MTRSYDLNTSAASQADGSYITETGKYIGILTRAEAVTSRQGTEGIELAFKSNSGTSADFLSLWTHNDKGDELPSFKTVNAIMTCLRVKSIKPVLGKVEKYNSETRQREIQEATIYPELMNKSVGLLLQKVWRADKPDKYKFEVAGVFEASTELTASEILAKATQPVKLGFMVAGLKDKEEKPRNGASSGASSAPASGGADFDDDIPF
jgi:hypothetical protein